VITRPFQWPEAVWAVAGAATLVCAGLLRAIDAWHGVLKGLDVYLFLIGMMALAEVARREGLFDWLASHAARAARGSASKLFALIYGVGIVVTVLYPDSSKIRERSCFFGREGFALKA
jgi:arsenical pump membrane protein